MRIKGYVSLNSPFLFSFMWSLYIFSYFIFTASEYSYKLNGVALFHIEQYGIILVLLFTILINKYDRYTLLKYLMFALFSLLMQIHSTDKTLLILTLFVMSSRGLTFKKIIKLDMIVKATILFLVVGSCLLGIIDNYSADINGTFKQSFGFSHPNNLGGLCYIILCEFMMLNWKDLKLRHFVCIICLGFGVILISGSRTMGYTFFLIYFLLLLYRHFPRLYTLKLIRLLFIIAMPVMFFTSFTLVKMYDEHNKLAIKLNDILTTRISLASNFLKMYDVKLWGQEVEMISTRAAEKLHVRPMILDNAYVKGTLLYGLLFMIFLTIAYMLLMNYFFKAKKVEYAIFSLYFILIGIGESYMLNIVFNTTLLLIIEHTIEKFSLLDIINDIRNGRMPIWKKQV